MSVPVLRSLHLKTFRSLPSAKIELDNPTFLVGRNAAGKSNVADAFALLSEAMASPLPAVFDRRGGIAAVRSRAGRGRPADVVLEARFADLDDEIRNAAYSFHLRASGLRGFEVVRESCSVRRGRRRAYFERTEGDFRSSVASLAPAPEPDALVLPLVGGNRRFRPVFRFLSRMRTYRIEPVSVREMQQPDDGARLRSDGSNAATVLREIKRQSADDWERVLELLRCIVPRAVDVSLTRHGNKVSLEVAERWTKSRRVDVDAHSLSDGTLRALGLLAAIYQPERPSLLVIEEPEATIHPGALGVILDLLRHAARFMQVVVTTHSPDVLDADWIEDNHLRIVNWKAGRTRVDPISDVSRAALDAHLMGAGELLRSNILTAAE